MTATVLLPTYQERDNIQLILRRIFECAPQIRVLVVDDNSPDGTADAARELMGEFPNLDILSRAGKEGLGRAYVAAFKAALEHPENEAMIMMDADFSHDPADLPRFLEAAETHDAVIGSRYIPGGSVAGWEGWRRTLSGGGNFYARAITGMPVNDATGGYNLIRTAMLRKIDMASLTNSGYAFQMGLKYRLWKLGARITELPIVFHQRRGGESKISGHIVAEGILAPWRLRLSK